MGQEGCSRAVLGTKGRDDEGLGKIVLVTMAGKGAMDYTETKVVVKPNWTGSSLLFNILSSPLLSAFILPLFSHIHMPLIALYC